MLYKEVLKVHTGLDSYRLVYCPIMGRMHNPGKGISQSALPYRRSVPTWLKLSSEDVIEQIVRLAKKVSGVLSIVNFAVF